MRTWIEHDHASATYHKVASQATNPSRYGLFARNSHFTSIFFPTSGGLGKGCQGLQ